MQKYEILENSMTLNPVTRPEISDYTHRIDVNHSDYEVYIFTYNEKLKMSNIHYFFRNENNLLDVTQDVNCVKSFISNIVRYCCDKDVNIKEQKPCQK